MPEYIEREALLETLKNWRDAHAAVDDEEGCGLIEDVMWEINAQATADVAPVVQGRWERRRNSWYCTNCGKGYIITYGMLAASAYSYCPNCGAKMNGGTENATD